MLALSFLLFILLQDYHNIHAAAYNSQVLELARQTAELADSRSKHSTLLLSRGALAHPWGVVPEIWADYRVVGSDLFLTTSFFILQGPMLT